MGREDDVIPQQANATSQLLSPYSSDHEDAETAQEPRSLTSNAPVQLPVEALAAPQEAQENAQQTAASQVNSGETTHNNSPMQQGITEEQLRVHLSDYYDEGDVMNPIMGLACAQILPMTIFLFVYMTEGGDNLTSLIVGFIPNVFVVQPVNCFMVVLLGLVRDVDNVVPVVNKGTSQDVRLGERLAVWIKVMPVVFFVADVAVLVSGGAVSSEAGFILALNLGVLFMLFCFMGIWYVLKPGAKRRRLYGQGRTNTLPVVAEGEHELEAVRVVPVER